MDPISFIGLEEKEIESLGSTFAAVLRHGLVVEFFKVSDNQHSQQLTQNENANSSRALLSLNDQAPGQNVVVTPLDQSQHAEEAEKSPFVWECPLSILSILNVSANAVSLSRLDSETTYPGIILKARNGMEMQATFEGLLFLKYLHYSRFSKDRNKAPPHPGS